MSYKSNQALPLPIEIHKEAPYLRLNVLQGPRIFSTLHEAICYGRDLMDVRRHTHYDEASREIQERWEAETDDFIIRGEQWFPKQIEDHSTASDLHVCIVELLELQRNREKTHVHVPADTMIVLWDTVVRRCQTYQRPSSAM